MTPSRGPCAAVLFTLQSEHLAIAAHTAWWHHGCTLSVYSRCNSTARKLSCRVQHLRRQVARLVQTLLGSIVYMCVSGLVAKQLPHNNTCSNCGYRRSAGQCEAGQINREQTAFSTLDARHLYCLRATFRPNHLQHFAELLQNDHLRLHDTPDCIDEYGLVNRH